MKLPPRRSQLLTETRAIEVRDTAKIDDDIRVPAVDQLANGVLNGWAGRS